MREHKIKTGLDVGAGNGRHSIFLANEGISVKAIDISKEGLKLLSKNAASIGLNIETEVISVFDYYDSNKYDLVLSTGGALNFLTKAASIQVIQRLKDNVHEGGYMYITVFTINDSAFKHQCELAETKQDDTYYSSKLGTWVTGFKNNELRMLFEDWEEIKYFEDNILDNGHGEPHYHHTAGILARKV
ncbi:MAG: class I SAM-dependent methyltransferase [Clostridium sp.]|uniref:class I SAM-dependent methyltransferase n=1 Tax=Clostridium sp. TaxID=1506 RepID=UPI0032179A47